MIHHNLHLFLVSSGFPEITRWKLEVFPTKNNFTKKPTKTIDPGPKKRHLGAVMRVIPATRMARRQLCCCWLAGFFIP